MPSTMDDFVRSAREFLDANAELRGGGPEIELGVGRGPDRLLQRRPARGRRAEGAGARAWQRQRYEAGFGWITGPEEFGGAGLTTVHEIVYAALEAEYAVPDTGVLSVIGLGMIGPTILAHGNPDTRERYLPSMYRGETIACQLFSEPGAGSDLAGVETRAERDGDTWLLNGQKVWTSIAQHADIGMALCRTDPDKPKHKGITAFLVDMESARRRRPAAAPDERRRRVQRGLPDRRRGAGQPPTRGRGRWLAGRAHDAHERASHRRRRSLAGGRRALSAVPRGAAQGQGRLQDAAARRALAELYSLQTATEYLNSQAQRRLRAGEHPGPEASVSKLMYAQNLTRGAHFAADVVGPRLVADTGAWGAFSWSELLLSVPALRILGGTEEIMKNILAERVLGLPKEPGGNSSTPFRELRRSGTSGGTA